MPRGGYRPGAGRPPGSKTRKTRRSGKAVGVIVKLPPNVENILADEGVTARDLKRKNQTPLDYMLGVMNDPDAEDGRRDRMAIAAAPFVHPRVADRPAGKKELEAEAAATATDGTDWAHLLQ